MNIYARRKDRKQKKKKKKKKRTNQVIALKINYIFWNFKTITAIRLYFPQKKSRRPYGDGIGKGFSGCENWSPSWQPGDVCG